MGGITFYYETVKLIIVRDRIDQWQWHDLFTGCLVFVIGDLVSVASYYTIICDN